MSTAFVNPSVMQRFQRLGQRRAPLDDDEIPLEFYDQLPARAEKPSELPIAAFHQPVSSRDEIPLDGMQQVPAQSSSPQELPIAPNAPGFSAARIAKSPLDAEIIAPPQNRIGSIPAGRDLMYRMGRDEAPAIPLGAPPQFGQQRASDSDEIPLGNIATVQPLSKEQEVDLTPIPENDKTREGYQSLYNAGTPKPEIPDHSKEHHGFWGNAWQHLKHAGKGAAIGALLGGRAGGAGALGGALLGGLTGAVSPHAADTMEYNTFTEPRWEHENQVAQQEAGRKAGIANHYAQTYGTALFDPNQRTEAARHNDDLANKYVAGIDATNRRLDQGDVRIGQSDRRLDQTDARLAQTEKDQRIGRILSAARIPGRTFNEQSRAELEKETGVTLPADFNPMTYDIIKTDKGYQVVSFPKTGGAPRVSPPIAQPPAPRPRPVPRATVESQVYQEWRNSGKIDADGYIVDPNARLTPAEQKQVDRARRLDGDAAAEARRQEFMKTKRAPYTHSPLFRNEVNGRIGQGGQQSPPTPPAKQQQMAAHEAEYQKYYSKATPEERKAMEDAFERDYGRPPRRPQYGRLPKRPQ